MFLERTSTVDADVIVGRWMQKVESERHAFSITAYGRNARFADMERTANRLQEYCQNEARQERLNWRTRRFMQLQDIDNWMARHNFLYLPDAGSAAVMQEDLTRWLGKIKKQFSTKKLTKHLSLMMQERVTHLTLDALPNPDERTPGRLTAMYWYVYEDRGLSVGFASFIESLKANVTAPFTVTVEFETFRELVKELEPGIVRLNRQRRDSFLTIQQGRNVARLTHYGVQHEQP